MVLHSVQHYRERAAACHVVTLQLATLQLVLGRTTAHRFLSSWPYMSQLPMVFSRSLQGKAKTEDQARQKQTTRVCATGRALARAAGARCSGSSGKLLQPAIRAYAAWCWRWQAVQSGVIIVIDSCSSHTHFRSK